MSNCLLPGYEKATPEKQTEILTETFQRVFSTDDGKVVLNALLYDLFYFTEATTESENALNQYAKYFIKNRLGIKNTFAVSNAIIDLVKRS
jgi:hypothetical protein